MMLLLRRSLLAAGAAIVLASCGGEQSNSTSAANAQDNPQAVADNGLADKGLGPVDAAVTVVEYASTTCPHCREFHETVVLPVLKPYAEAGKIRYIFRDFPTAPVNLAIAGAVIARCAEPDRYFDVLDDLFDKQPGIMAAARAGEARSALETLAARHGISAETMDRCLQDEDLRQQIIDIVQDGQARGVTATPTVFLNGRKLTPTESRTPESITQVIDAAIAAASGEASSATEEGDQASPVAESEGE